MSKKDYAKHDEVKHWDRPDPSFLLALNKRSLELAKDFLYSRNTFVLPKGKLTSHYFHRYFRVLCLDRIHSVSLALSWKDVKPDIRTMHHPMFYESQQARRERKYTLLTAWAAKFNSLEALPYADHVTVDLCEAHDPDGLFIGESSVSKILRVMKVPPCIKLVLGSKKDKDHIEDVQKKAVRVVKPIRPCRFCRKSARDDSVRFLQCFEPLPMPAPLPAKLTSRIGISTLEERR